MYFYFHVHTISNLEKYVSKTKKMQKRLTYIHLFCIMWGIAFILWSSATKSILLFSFAAVLSIVTVVISAIVVASGWKQQKIDLIIAVIISGVVVLSKYFL